jgi:hypothetical protein
MHSPASRAPNTMTAVIGIAIPKGGNTLRNKAIKKKAKDNANRSIWSVQVATFAIVIVGCVFCATSSVPTEGFSRIFEALSPSTIAIKEYMETNVCKFFI